MTPRIPKRIHRGGRQATHPWATMKLGEFFFVPKRDKNTMSSLAWSTGKKLGRTFSTRLCYMKHQDGLGFVDTILGKPVEAMTRGSVLGIGVWRTK